MRMGCHGVASSLRRRSVSPTRASCAWSTYSCGDRCAGRSSSSCTQLWRGRASAPLHHAAAAATASTTHKTCVRAHVRSMAEAKCQQLAVQCCAALMPAAAELSNQSRRRVWKQPRQQQQPWRSKRKMPTILLMAATEVRRPLLLPRLLPIRRLCTPLPNLHHVHIAIPHLPPRRSADDVHNTPGRRDPTLQRCDHRLRASLACRHRPARSSTKHAAFHRHRGVHSSGRRLRLGTRRACRHRQSQGRGARRRWLAWGIVRGCLCGASWRRGALLWRWLRRRGAQLGA